MSKLIKICKSSEIPDNKRGKKFILDDGTEIAVFGINNKSYAVINMCPHIRKSQK